MSKKRSHHQRTDDGANSPEAMKKAGMSSVDAATVNSATNELIVFGMPSDVAIVEKVIEKMSLVLKSGGKVVIKISDSKIKKVKIETGKFMTLIAENYGFVLHDVFLDEINNNSRSLTTARNTYSDIITNDYIIIWEKK